MTARKYSAIKDHKRPHKTIKGHIGLQMTLQDHATLQKATNVREMRQKI